MKTLALFTLSACAMIFGAPSLSAACEDGCCSAPAAPACPRPCPRPVCCPCPKPCKPAPVYTCAGSCEYQNYWKEQVYYRGNLHQGEPTVAPVAQPSMAPAAAPAETMMQH